MRRHQTWMFAGAVALAVVGASACSESDADGSAISPIEVAGAQDGGEEAVADLAGPDADAEVAVEPDAGGADGDGTAGGGAEGGGGSDFEVEVDVTVIPEEITPEYVEAVLAELELLYVEALRALMVAGEPTIEVTAKLGSAFSEPQYQARLEELSNVVERNFERLAPVDELKPRKHDVIEVVDSSLDCIYAETDLDASGILATPQDALRSFALLGPPDVERPDRRTETPWVIVSLPVGDANELREQQPCG